MCTKRVVLNIKGLLGCSCPIPLYKLILVWNVKCINIFHVTNSIQILTLTIAIIHMYDSAATIKLTMEFKLYTECNSFYFCHGNGCSEKMSQMVQVYLIFDSFFLLSLTGSCFIKEKLCYRTLHRWKLSNIHYIHYYQSTWLNTKAIMIWIFVAELSLLDQQKWWWFVTMFSPGFGSSKSPENEKWCLGRVRAIL